jgi:hypothetical protein
MLKDGKKLIEGKLQQDTQEYFSASMMFAVDIPLNDLGYRTND